ncbi:acetate--CoA ligase family protein [Desulfobacterales bacterium HSG16]|nr:acetate--CoA ligase family protein [Desulfobacterales bacterium HSG16]
MNIYVDFTGIENLFKNAFDEGRNFLYEYEVYELIRLIGSETPLRYHFHPKDSRLDIKKIDQMPGDKLVIKVVSESISHKSEVGGVCVVDKEPEQILSAIRRMQYEIPEKYFDLIKRKLDHIPQAFKDCGQEDLKSSITKDIRGFLLCRFVPFDLQEFGNELLISIRKTREFGMIINAGLGGTDTELYAERFKKGEAVVAASTAMTGSENFFRLFKETVSYQKLSGQTRSQKRLVTDEQLIECFAAFIAVANYFSPLNPDASFVIEELEINPFAFTNYLMLPLDGLCRFSVAEKQPFKKPIEKIDYLLHPSTIGLIGASAKGFNLGRMILTNIIKNGFDKENIFVIHPDSKSFEGEGLKTFASLPDIKQKLDLIILAVGAGNVPALVDEILEKDLAHSVMMIPGGLGEVAGSEDIGRDLCQKISNAHQRPDGGPVFLGGNCLGILSHPGRYDSLFVPDERLPIHRGQYSRKSVFISQSGAYMITRMSKLFFLDPAYAISIGNQTDLTVSDITSFINTLDDIKIFAIYMEGFTDLDGLTFAESVKEAVLKGKEVIFYKAGRTPEGKSATSGHTASVAGDYMVCESAVRQAGAIVATTFTGFEGLFRLAVTLHDKKIRGNRLAAISNAGYESVGIADNILGEDFRLEMAEFSHETNKKIEEILKAAKLDSLVNIKNPTDVTPMADEDLYELVIRALMEDEGVDAVVAAVIPLTPLMKTLPDSEKSLVKRIPKLAKSYDKPLIMVIDTGSMYDTMADSLQESGLPVFRSADYAVWLLGKYIQGRLKMDKIREDN